MQLFADNFTSKLRSLRDPHKKMSKSDVDAKSRICLTDKPDDIAKKIRKAVTDFNSQVKVYVVNLGQFPTSTMQLQFD